MDNKLLLQYLNLQCNIFNIPFYVYDGKTRVANFEPSNLTFDLVSPWITELIESSTSPNYILTDDLLLFGRVCDDSSKLSIIIGPTRICHIKTTTLHNIVCSSRPFVSVKDINKIEQYLNSSTAFSLEQFLPILCSLHIYLNNQFISIEEIINKSASITKVDCDTEVRMLETTIEHTYNEDTRRNNFDIESEIMFYISHGMTNKLKSMQIPHKNMANFSLNSLRHYKNALIILNTLSQRAAIIGGLDPEISYQLGEIYIQKIEACKDINSLMQLNLNQKLTLDYCQRVNLILHPLTKNHKINDAMHFVRENYQRRLTVDEIAKEIGLTSEYLSTKFRQVIGMTLPTYINKHKINEAKELLHFTDMSLLEISEYLSFSSQSYFQTTFKKFTGFTPMEYRLQKKIYV